MQAPKILPLSALLLLSACGSPDEPATVDPDPDPGVEEVEDTDGDYLGELEEQEPPSFEVAEVQEAVDAALALALAINAVPVVGSYLDITADTDADCPTWYAQDEGDDYWYDSCTTAAGTIYEGYGLASAYEGFEAEDGGTYWGWQVYGVGTLTEPEGYELKLAGSASVLAGFDAEGRTFWYSALSSGFAYDGPGAEGTWLANGLSPELGWYALEDPESGGRYVVVNGRTTIEEGPIQAVVFDEITLANAALGAACPEEAAGTISILDRQGAWVDLSFDGSDATGACDGCADAWYQGTWLGEACVDFSPLIDWEESPFGSGS